MVKTINPATGEEIREFAEQGADWLEPQVARSVTAYRDWSRRTLTERLGAVQRLEQALRRDREGLARSMTLEMGKPLKQALLEVDKSIASCHTLREHYPVWLKERQYTTEAGHSIHLLPLGPLLGIMPWNFPLWQVIRFAVPSLLNGNTILLKHAPNTWGTAEKIEKCFTDAFPENTYVHLPVGVELTGQLIEDDRIRGVSLTGSRRAGSAVAERAGRSLKKCVLELGGSDAYVVFEDADVDRAALICAEARLQNAGQSCVAAKRFIVHRSKIEAFTEKMAAVMAKKRLGDPMQMETEMGPMARVDLREELHRQVERSVSQGARIVIGGKFPEGRGFFYPPTILTGVQPGQAAFDEELFGPVAAVIEAPSDREALRLANLSRYGLGGAIFSRGFERAKALAIEEFEAGMVFVNDYVRSDALVPFGGIKDSGLGRELGREGCFEFVNIKTVLAASKA